METFMMEDPSDVILTHMYSEELDRATVEALDLDLAFTMQMEEALADSVGKPLSGQCARTQPRRLLSVGLNYEDTAIAYRLQQAEVKKIHQSLEDQNVAKEKMKETQEEYMRRVHDEKFARSLSRVSDEVWERDGDLLESPFCGQPQVELAPINCIMHFDGASRGNPGHGGAGVMLKTPEGSVLGVVKKYLGESVTNYAAEYMALIEGLRLALACGITSITVHSDSELVCNQVNGHWKCKNDTLTPLLGTVKELQSRFMQFSIRSQRRQGIRDANRLANEAIDEYVATHNVSKNSRGKGRQRNCAICLEIISAVNVLSIEACSHEFCRECLMTYAEMKVKDRKAPIECPQADCHQTLSADECRCVLSPFSFQVLVRLEAEAAIPDAEKIYCPFPDCSSLMTVGIDRSCMASSSYEPPSIGAAECHECFRLFCVDCQVPWHSDRTCAEYQALPPDMRNAEDMKLHQLAEKHKWRRCGKCGLMIELAYGCYHMTCRCGFEFCYTCGAPWEGGVATCQCALWDEDHLTAPNGQRGPQEVGGRFYRTRLCRYWAQGNCRRGLNCPFAHGEEQLR